MKSVKLFLLKAVMLISISCAVNSVVCAQHYIAENELNNKIKFVGMEGELLVFDLQFCNLPPKGSVLRILDGDKNLIHEERINSQNYSRRYKIICGDISKLYFELSGKQIILEQSFLINYKVETKWEITKA